MTAEHQLSRAREIHTALVETRRRNRQTDYECAVLLAKTKAEKLHQVLGYGSLSDYAERELDLSPRQAREWVRLGQTLPERPVLRKAFASGELGWTAAREVLRVASAENEAEWVQRAKELTSRNLEQLVSATPWGEPPAKTLPKEPARRRVVFTMDTVDAELLEKALALLRHQTGISDLDRGAALAQMAQGFLGSQGEEAPTSPRFRKVVMECPHCEAATGETAETTETTARMANCDAEVIDLRKGPKRGHRSRTIPPATRRAVLSRDRNQCAVPTCSCRIWLDVHHIKARWLGGDHSEENLITLCSAHHRRLHDGYFGIWTEEGGVLAFAFADGRVIRRDPRGALA